jgi:hypothetical protein
MVSAPTRSAFVARKTGALAFTESGAGFPEIMF